MRGPPTETAPPAAPPAAPSAAVGGGFDSMVSPLTPAERAHFATLSEADQEMARVMVRLRHRVSTLAPKGAYDTFYRLVGVSGESATVVAKRRAQKAAAPLVESFLASLARDQAQTEQRAPAEARNAFDQTEAPRDS